jgi:DNA repair protein RadA/Sms
MQRTETENMMSVLTVGQAVSLQPRARLVTGLAWFDLVLGGGLIRGSCTLLYGAPGAGKSTLLAQVAGSVPGALYVALEEPLSAVAARFIRLGLGRDTRLSDEVVSDPATLLVLDSLQLTAEGAVETAKRVVDAARAQDMAVVMVCHATKAGEHAGPRLIEHLGDATLRLDRDPRALVCLKNRFGAAPVWVPLIMTERGLRYDASDDSRAAAGADDRRSRR